MNDERRTRLRTALALLDRANAIIKEVHEEEHDSLTNVPDSLRWSDRAQWMEYCMQYLKSATDDLGKAISNVKQVTG